MMNRSTVLRRSLDSLLRKLVSPLLITALIVTPGWAKGAEKAKPDIHQQVTMLRVGSKANVVLTDGTLKQGKIASIDEQSFTLDGGKKAGVATISYTSVKSIAKGGLTKTQIGIVAGVGLAAVFGAAYLVAAGIVRGF
jgi:hypothetical protein